MSKRIRVMEYLTFMNRECEGFELKIWYFEAWEFMYTQKLLN